MDERTDDEHVESAPENEDVLEHLATDGVFVVDRDRKIISFSEAAERITGYSYAEVFGTGCDELFQTEACEQGCPVSRTLETGEIVPNVNVEVGHRNGSRVLICASVSPLRDVRGEIAGALVTFRDIAEMERLGRTLRERNAELLLERNKLQAILDSIADGVFTVDENWRITSFNRAAEEITGHRSEEVLGQPCRSVFRSETCMGICPLRQTLEWGGNTYGAELEIRTKEGANKPISVSTALLYDEEGVPIGGVETFRDLSRIRQLTEELEGRYRFDRIVGKSKRMQELYDLLENVSGTDATVLVQGESGTGKELVARAVHRHSDRREGPFVAVNCPALPEQLLESELFGHEKGAFTGAIRRRPGRFELAAGGTLFLDEVGEMSPGVQAKLLRVLDQHKFERVGGDETIQVDVRILAATNRTLEEEVERGTFRRDLYYRLNVIAIWLPPLREHPDDIPLLIDHFVTRFNEKMDRQIRGVSPDAMRILTSHGWPGNVRELENALEHAFVQCRGDLIRVEDLPRSLGSEPRLSDAEVPAAGERPLEEGERRVLLRVLEDVQGNRGEAARRLGVSRTTLWRKMKTYGLM